MKNMGSMMGPKLYLLVLVTYLIISSVSNANSNSKNMNNTLDCEREEIAIEDVLFLNNTNIFLKALNITVHSSHYYRNDEKVYICISAYNDSRENMIADCKEVFVFESDEFDVFPNGSALIFGNIIEPREYQLQDGTLLFCSMKNDHNESGNFTSKKANKNTITISVVGKIGSGISIMALILHLVTFCFLPSQKNLPGYNLASLSVAFLFAYSFFLIGQIEDVVGSFCVVSAILQHNFFLAAFSCMNVMAFDVWRTLKLVTEKLIVDSNNAHKRHYLLYSLYAWGFPLIICTTAVILDNIPGIPEKFKPYYGKEGICWFNNNLAKEIFLVIPAFILCVINALFFISSYLMISRNTMKCSKEQQNKTVQLNYVLYLRLGIMMGLTWLVGIIGLISKNDIVWFIHDLLNSLQGLFLFLLFTCTRKVARHIKQKASFKSYPMEKMSSRASKSSSIKLETQ